MLAQMSIVK
ncbi:unnamed protein product, partial [Didymodactylos carnosus]